MTDPRRKRKSRKEDNRENRRRDTQKENTVHDPRPLVENPFAIKALKPQCTHRFQESFKGRRLLYPEFFANARENFTTESIIESCYMVFHDTRNLSRSFERIRQLLSQNNNDRTERTQNAHIEVLDVGSGLCAVARYMKQEFGWTVGAQESDVWMKNIAIHLSKEGKYSIK